MHRLTPVAVIVASLLSMRCGEDSCEPPFKLSNFCDRAGCPESLESIRESYCMPKLTYDSKLQANDCDDGKTLIATLGLSGMRYDFAGNGKLVAVESWDDVEYGTCDLTHYTYGPLCKLIGESEPACVADAGM